MYSIKHKILEYLNGYIKFKKTVRLGGHFHTAVLDNTIKLPYLRTTPGTQKQKGKKGYITHIWEYPPPGLLHRLEFGLR